MVFVFDAAILAEGGAEEPDRVGAVGLDFEVDGAGGLQDGYRILLIVNSCQLRIYKCVATHEMQTCS